MELTKEYFDQVVKGLVTKEHLDKTINNAVAPLATKKDVREAVDDLARIVADTIATPFTKRFNQLEKLLEVKEDIETLKKQMTEIRSALHLST